MTEERQAPASEPEGDEASPASAPQTDVDVSVGAPPPQTGDEASPESSEG